MWVQCQVSTKDYPEHWANPDGCDADIDKELCSHWFMPLNLTDMLP
jgi:hypothetical protein